MASPPVLSHQDYTVGWICALSVEAAAGKAMLDDKHPALRQDEHDHNKYTLGRVGPHNVVITCLPAGVPGTNAAAMVATQMLRTFTQIKFCLMVGVGGGVPSEEHDIRLGDVAVGLGVVQYDFGKTVQGGKFHQTGALNKPSGFLLTALGELQSRHMMEGNHFSSYLSDAFEKYPMMATTFAYPGDEHDFVYESDYDHPEGHADCSRCEKKHLTTRLSRSSHDPTIYYGLIASGNQVMRHGATREKLRKQIGVICFEMEAAGLVDIFPCLVIRGVCDYSDSHKNKKWQPYAAVTAACFAKEFLFEIEVAQVQEIRMVAEMAVQSGPFQPISRTQSQISSFQTSSSAEHSKDSQGRAGSPQPESRPKSGLDGLPMPVDQQLSGHTQTMATDISQSGLEAGGDMHAGIILETEQGLFAANKDFQEAMRQFKSSLSHHQHTAFRSTTFRDVRSTLMRVQKEQANRSGSMDLPRVNKFLEGLRAIEKKMQFAEKAEFIACVLGTMKSSLQATSNLPNAFDTFVKAYKAIGESITFGDAGSSWLSDSPQKHLVLAGICSDILQLHTLVLRALSIPIPILGQTFSSTWSALLPRWEQLSQGLQGYKDLAENRKSASAVLEYEQRRLLNLRDRQAETVEARHRWSNIKQWLAGTDSLQNHDDIRRIRQGTPKCGAWLLKHPKYVAWRSDDVPQTPILWLSGILGAGKTVLISGVIDDCRQDNSVSTAFFYCHHGDPQRTSFMSILRAIIAQLLTIDHVLLPWCYEQYAGSNQLSLVDEKTCTDMLTSILLSNNKTFVVLDGLDECEQRDRSRLLNFFSRAVSVCESHDPGKLRVMFVSRDEHDIRRALHASSEITITSADNEGDMKRFIKIWCKKIGDKFEELGQAEIDYISESTFHRADGMFMFAKLVMTNLHDQISLDALQEQILPENFPDGLDAAYDRILNRVSNDLDSNKVALAKKVLGWMTCARRPLKWHEIQGALSTNTTDRTVDFVQHRSRVHIREICGSLISNLSGDRLELVHVSAKDYLIKSSFVKLASAESNLASLCLNYLTFDCFEEHISEEQLTDLLLRGSFAFQDYAASHWSDHASAVIKAGPSALLCQEGANESIKSALIDFIAHYQLGVPADTEIQEIDSHCLQFQELGYFAEISHISRHIQQQRAKGRQGFDEITPQPLDHAIMSNRAALEKLARSATLDLETKGKLEQSYGRKWYKCTKAACYYFHEGFLDEKSREYHVVRHEQPFRCRYMDCESGYKLGFTTMKQLEKHLSVHHPECTKIKAIFARLRKDREQGNDSPKQATSTSKHPAKFSCHICLKAYTRREKLNNHLRTHSDERVLVKCSIAGCGKSFARDDERKRHEKEVHYGEKRFSCTGELKYGIPGSNIYGCGKAFPRLSALVSHWRSNAGQACLKPLHDEEERERQWQDQIAKRKAEGLELPLPRQLYDQFPELRRSISEGLSLTATGAEGQSFIDPDHKKWQPFKPSPTPEATSSQASAG